MTDYQDSLFWAGSSIDTPGIWLRKPVIDGVTKANEAMRLLDQARKEVQAIQNVIGTDIRGSKSDLAARLDVRLSPSGIPRGFVHRVDTNDWFTGGISYVQFGVDTLASTGIGTQVVTFPRAYFTSLQPDVIVLHFSTVSQQVGAVQLDITSVTTTQFRYRIRARQGAGGWGNPDQLHDVLWAAFGGFPAS